MLNLVIYEAKVALLLAVFYICYRVLLSRETLHRLNRIVLTGSVIVSFLLPFCVLTIHRTVEVAAGAVLGALVLMVINAVVLVFAVIIMLLARAYYLPMLKAMGTNGGTIVIAIIVAVVIMSRITVGNIFAIKRKIKALWIQQS